MIGALEIGRAARLLREVAVTTPVMPCQAPGWAKGVGPVLLKCENLQRTGSFKVRGAYVRVAGLPEPARSRGVATASAGNHGKGSPSRPPASGPGRRCGCPRAHPETKVAATRQLGARVELVDGAITAVLDRARAEAAEGA